MMKKILVLLNLTLLAATKGQVTISPQVLNSAGQHTAIGTSGLYITDNVGEPFTETVGGSGNFLVTEGFLQPEKVTIAGFTVSGISQGQQCLGRDEDSFISLAITSPVIKYNVFYYWSDPKVCPNNDCSRIDTIAPGRYDVKVVFQYTNNVNVVIRDSVVKTFDIGASSTPCNIKVYNGITANNDHNNDFFTVENLKEYPKNRVTIYNRWGNVIADISGYNEELSDKRWPRDEDLSKLQATTYFYIIELGDGSKPIKGWVELFKN